MIVRITGNVSKNFLNLKCLIRIFILKLRISYDLRLRHVSLIPIQGINHKNLIIFYLVLGKDKVCIQLVNIDDFKNKQVSLSLLKVVEEILELGISQSSKAGVSSLLDVNRQTK
jgi:hypothetical protein